MPTQRMKLAVNDLDKINQKTSVELEELEGAIERVEELHREHMEEMKADRKFIKDLKNLYKEIRAVNRIEQHMRQEVEAYGEGNMSKQEFNQRFIDDERKFVNVVEEIRTELREMIRILSEEERLTNKDLDIEGATEDLLRKLNEAEEDLEDTHRELEDLILE